jgi:beta-glucanase (GH16 family)
MKQKYWFVFLSTWLLLVGCGTSVTSELDAEAFSGNYVLQVKHSGLVLEVPSTANSTQARQNTRNNSSAQQFRLEDNGGGWYKIVHASSNKALEVDNQYFWLNGTKVQLWDKYTYDNQLWQPQAVAGGYYKIINKQSGKALEVSGISVAAGAKVQQWDYLAQDNQHWRLIAPSSAPTPTPTPTPTSGQPVGPGGSWKLSFSDEFGGSALDTSKWNYGFGWGSPYSNAFMECTSPSQVRVASGILTITPKNAPGNCGRTDGYGNYTSGAIQTKNKFSQQYGYFEVRMKGAQGSGFASAFWGKRADESWPPEIDVVEILGKNKRYYHTVHHKSPYAGSNDKWDSGSNFGAFDPTAGFHTYGVEWSPTFIKWYVDGKLVKEFKDYTDGTPPVMPTINGKAFYWILNLHIGSPTWQDMGIPNSTTNWSSTMQVDWVRIWKK